MPAGHPDISASTSSPLKWKTPEGWNEVPPGEMRVASFKVQGKDGKQAEVSAIPLPGTAGGDLPNVNRWRVQQLGLQPVTAEELKKLAQPVEVGSQSADLYDVVGKNPGSSEPTRILGVIQHREGMAWFFKMTGDDQLVAQQKTAFIEFLKSVQFAAAEAKAGLPPSHPPIDGSAAAPAAAAISREGKPNWQVPAGWKEIPGGQFLIAKFSIVAEGGTAAVNVSSSAGDGGGLLANVNRWRQMQLGLPAATEADLTKLSTTIEVAGGKATLVDMTGTDKQSGQPARIVGVMVPQGSQTWFYKLMGDVKSVAVQKDAFTKFVQTVKY